MKYDGTKDPQEHLTAFEARMNLEGAADAVRCSAFLVTLVGPAIKWFNALPNGSITDFHDISWKFMAQFTTRITKAKHPISLLGVTQRQEESTRKYLDRFNDECLTVDGLTDSVASLCLTNGLMNEDFQKHLTTKLVWTMHEIQSITKEYINDEESGNKALYCDYHRGYRHRTQDCFDLKDTLKQAIQDGELPEFTKIIREPRRGEKERSPEREGRNPRTQRQGPRKNRETDPTIIVNVITGKDIPGKSKSALKKDLKILAVKHQNPTTTTNRAITFSPEDCQHSTSAEDAPFVILAKIGTGLVRRILVDTGADSNILFRGAFDKLGLRNDNLHAHCNGVTRLGDNFLKSDGSITLPLTIGTGNHRKTILYEFVVLKDSTVYNIILGRKTINDLSTVIFTKYLLMKFTVEYGSVETIHGDRETVVECDNTSLAL
ncbi:uncharacterized protein LOC130962620 [Arachis stenosperma]|uniref:uncharacterized protein LOC130962620 n=1 Tax=Arachis stenosperma TaxID=217475 RepID=UPI0025AC8DAD|nr:uncharacterized protein LOC130962620 [Arachis stenosperma]